MSPRISLQVGGQSYTMVSRPQSRDRRAFLIPIFLLTMALFTSWRVLSPSFLTQLDVDEAGRGHVGGGQQSLKGSVTKADRLPSWVRTHAIDKLPYYMNRSHASDGYLDEIKNALFPRKQINNSTANQTVIDVVTIGSRDRMKYMHAQQMAWASNKHSVRNVSPILSEGGNCQALIQVCAASGVAAPVENPKQQTSSDQNGDNSISSNITLEAVISSQLNEGAICLGRRLGFAIGASTRRYRKMVIHALALANGGLDITDLAKNGLEQFGNTNVSSNELNQYITSTLPTYLIITFDSVYYNTKQLEECLVDSRDANNVPIIYAPFASWTDENLSNQYQDQEDTNESLRFAYPTNQAGVVFNKAALEIFVRPIECFSWKDSTSSSAPQRLHYDSTIHDVEHHFCNFLADAVMVNDDDATTNKSREDNIFDIAIRETLQISLSVERDDSTKKYDEFAYSSLYQPVSISDIFSIYSSTLHELCKYQSDMGVLERIPSGEEMLGYLIHRFQLSAGGIIIGSSPDENPLCKAASSQCDTTSMVACANLTLLELKDLE